MTLMKKAAQIVSIVLQPIFIPLYGLIMLLYGDILLRELSVASKFAVALIVFLTTAIVPAAVVAVGMWRGRIKDEFISDRRERTVPYLLSLAGYVACIVWLHYIGLSLFYLAPLIGSAISLVVILAVNFRWKISAHMSAMGGWAGGIFAYSYIVCSPLLLTLSLVMLLGGMVGTSRIILKAHTLGQVCCGWLTGFVCVAGAWILITL